jgi:hypothetical protein
MNSPQSTFRYAEHLRATLDWLLHSIEAGGGGSSAHFSPLRGWSAPYPETTGYIIPTLLEAARTQKDQRYQEAALRAGQWLLSLQCPDGAWPGGLYAVGRPQGPSVFNTAQIIDGMVALARLQPEGPWMQASARAAGWLAAGVDSAGLWQVGNYRNGVNPSYYAQVAWPMLQAWQLSGDDAVRAAAERVLARIVELRTRHGSIAGWGFDPGKPAFTHTIAYTLRGLIESAGALENWPAYGQPCEDALERLGRKAEFGNGRLPGAFQDDWRPVNWYTCLTGNAQVALCLLRIEQRANDLRLVNAATKLVDSVCANQRIRGVGNSRRGAVGGSAPLWGRYMFMRYPNWAAKYHADALMMLMARLEAEDAR